MRCLMLVTLLLTTSAFAAGTRHVIGVERLDYLPHYAIEDGDFIGYSRDILDAFAKSQNLEFEYRPLPIVRLYGALLSGEIDFKYPDAPQWNASGKRGATVSYSAPVAPYVDGVVMLPERVGQPVARIKRLGTVKGFTPWAWKERLDARQVRLFENPSFTGLMRQAMAGRIDGAYVNVAVASHYLGNVLQRFGALTFDPGLPHISASYHLSTTTHPALLQTFDAWLQKNEALVNSKRKEWGL